MTRFACDDLPLPQFFEKYEGVKLENSKLREANRVYQLELGRSRHELASIRTAIDNYKSADAKQRRSGNRQSLYTLGREHL